MPGPYRKLSLFRPETTEPATGSRLRSRSARRHDSRHPFPIVRCFAGAADQRALSDLCGLWPRLRTVSMVKMAKRNSWQTEAIWLGRASMHSPPSAGAGGDRIAVFRCFAREKPVRAARRNADGRYVPLDEQDTGQLERHRRSLKPTACCRRGGRFRPLRSIPMSGRDSVRSPPSGGAPGATDWTALVTHSTTHSC